MEGLDPMNITLITHLVAAVVAAAAAWAFQGARMDAAVAEVRLEQSTAKLKRSEAARADEIQTASKESTHAADTSKNSDEFTTSQPVRDAIARADLDRVDRLRIGAERRAATYRQIAQACTTSSSGIADRLEAFDRHIVEGAAVVAEHRAALIRRDSEVRLLLGQIDADRALMADGPATSGLGVR